MKNALTFFFIFIVVFVKAQSDSECQKSEEFLMKLNKFRYSLYADLIPQKETILNFSDSLFFDSSSVYVKKSRQFYNENTDAIKAYQTYELERYSKTDIDFSKFVADTTFNDILSDSAGWLLFSSILSSYSYMTFSPISYAFSLNSMLLARIKTPSELGSSALINNLASPMIKTKMLQNNKWEIIIDNYEYIFVHEYNLSDNKIKVTKILKRLKKTI